MEDVDLLTGMDSGIFPEEPWPRRAFAQTVLPRRDSRTLLAVDGDEVVGYCCASLEPERLLHVTNLAVRPRWRRSGVGSLLAAEMEAWGARRGCGSATLEVRSGNPEAIGFYDARGYLREGVIEGYYRWGDALVMGRPLRVRTPSENKIAELSESLGGRLSFPPPVGVVLGSGLSWLVDSIGTSMEFDMDDLPHMQSEKLPGHPGRIAVSSCGRLLFLLGRRHRYQGFDAAEISLLPCALSDLGTCTWILTSSAGGLFPDAEVGSAVLFEDHMNLSGSAPDWTASRCGGSVYSERLRSLALQCAAEKGADLRSGVFAYVTGPAYETPSEVDLLGYAGAAAVSMSTVPEALALAQLGCSTIALALVANTIDGGMPLSHAEVLAAQPQIRRRQEAFLTELLKACATYAGGSSG
jgi:purine-nucleoside phosphorylase